MLGTTLAACGGGATPSRELVGDTTFVRHGRLDADTAVVTDNWFASLAALATPNSAPVRVWDLEVAVGGEVFVARSDGVVLGFEPDGTPRARFGPGDGAPWGANPVTLGARSDGRLAVRDDHGRLLHMLDADGSLVESHPLTPGLVAHGRDAVSVDNEGDIWLAITPSEELLADTLRFPRPVYGRVTADGLADTIWVGNPSADRCVTPSHAHFRSGWFEDIRVRYFPKVKWALGPDRSVATGCPAAYEWSIARAGSITRVSAGRAAPAVGDDERSSFGVTWTLQMRQAHEDDREEWGWMGAAIPSVKPTYQRILVADHGDVWVWPTRPSERVAAPPTWPLVGLPAVIFTEPRIGAFDVFAPDGGLRGHVRLPDEVAYTGLVDTPDPVVRGDTVWAIVADSLGAKAVARYTVGWPTRGGGVER